MNTIAPFSRPLYVMAKPVGARCNLRCRYCYYLEKAQLYADKDEATTSSDGRLTTSIDEQATRGNGQTLSDGRLTTSIDEQATRGNGLTSSDGRLTMSDATLELFTKQYFEAQTQQEVLFTWHGGEPLLRPLSFYRKALAYQQQYGHGWAVNNCLQTNGTLLNDEWCEFFHDNGWLIGLSIDGPAEIHDAYRRTADGRGTHCDVLRAIDLLNRHQVEWNAMAVVNHLNVKKPREFYRFFRDHGCRYLQFAPIVERDADGQLTDESVHPGEWGDFLIALFDEWVRQDVGTMFVELFDCTLANWCGVTPGICVYARECGHAGVMEHNGDVYSCDHFVYPEHRLGNIHRQTLTELLYGEQQQRFSDLKHKSLPKVCKQCRFEFACHGECPKNRFAVSPDGEPGLNYLCEGYYRFYRHVAPYMDIMVDELDHHRAPANVMQRLSEVSCDA